MAALEVSGMSLITKFGWLKLTTLGAATAGAALMAVFRPPLTRKELFLQAVVALGTSLLFGNTVADILLHYFPFIEVTNLDGYIHYLVAIHGLVGAMSWGTFGGLAHLRDKVGEQSLLETVKDVKHSVD